MAAMLASALFWLFAAIFLVLKAVCDKQVNRLEPITIVMAVAFTFISGCFAVQHIFYQVQGQTPHGMAGISTAIAVVVTLLCVKSYADAQVRFYTMTGVKPPRRRRWQRGG